MSRMWVCYAPPNALSITVPPMDDVKIDMDPVRHMHWSFACGEIGLHVRARLSSELKVNRSHETYKQNNVVFAEKKTSDPNIRQRPRSSPITYYVVNSTWKSKGFERGLHDGYPGRVDRSVDREFDGGCSWRIRFEWRLINVAHTHSVTRNTFISAKNIWKPG